MAALLGALAAGCGDEDDVPQEAQRPAATAPQEHLPPVRKRPAPMPVDRFWSLVDRSRDPSIERAAAKLTGQLSRLSPVELVAFNRTFDRQLERSAHWDHWAACFIINAGCGDDSYDYYRMWLVAQGRASYARVLEDPSYAGRLTTPARRETYGESYSYVAGEVYEQRTGRTIPLYRADAGRFEPKGEEWEEETVDKRLPALARRYG